jgi:hypothetical protein
LAIEGDADFTPNALANGGYHSVKAINLYILDHEYEITRKNTRSFSRSVF